MAIRKVGNIYEGKGGLRKVGNIYADPEHQEREEKKQAIIKENLDKAEKYYQEAEDASSILGLAKNTAKGLFSGDTYSRIGKQIVQNPVNTVKSVGTGLYEGSVKPVAELLTPKKYEGIYDIGYKPKNDVEQSIQSGFGFAGAVAPYAALSKGIQLAANAPKIVNATQNIPILGKAVSILGKSEIARDFTSGIVGGQILTDAQDAKGRAEQFGLDVILEGIMAGLSRGMVRVGKINKKEVSETINDVSDIRGERPTAEQERKIEEAFLNGATKEEIVDEVGKAKIAERIENPQPRLAEVVDQLEADGRKLSVEETMTVKTELEAGKSIDDIKAKLDNPVESPETALKSPTRAETPETVPKAAENSDEAFLKAVEERFKASKTNKFREATRDEKGQFTGSRKGITGDAERDELAQAIQNRIDAITDDSIPSFSAREDLRAIQEQVARAKTDDLARLKIESDRIAQEVLDRRASKIRPKIDKEKKIAAVRSIARDSDNFNEFQLNLKKRGEDITTIFKSKAAAEEFYRRNSGAKYRTADPDADLLQEIRKYKSAEEFVKVKGGVDEKTPNVYWHGSASGDLRGGLTGLHVGTKEAATQALEARIGIPADGKGWTGNRAYGETLLAGKDSIESGKFGKYKMSGINMDFPKEDFYIKDHPELVKKMTYGDKSQMPLTVKPEVAPYRIKGPMTNSTLSPHEDWKANGYMAGQIKKGTAKRGYYYKNIAEDEGSISATVPNGNHLERLQSKSQLTDLWKKAHGEKFRAEPISKSLADETEAGYQVRAEMENSTAGRREVIGDGMDREVVGIPSTFPKWVSTEYRSTDLFEKVLEHIDNGTVPKSSRQLGLYNEARDEMQKRAARFGERFEELTGTKLTPEQEAKIKELHKKMFGDDGIEITAQILTPEGQKAFGVYKNKVIKILDGQVDPTDTFYHESVHKYLDLFTTLDEQKRIYVEARKLWKTDNLDELEEKIAENFIRYAKTNEGVVGTMKVLFDKVIERIKTAIGGESSIEALYKDILEGKARTGEITTLPKDVSVLDESKRVGAKRISPDRTAHHQFTPSDGIEALVEKAKKKAEKNSNSWSNAAETLTPLIKKYGDKLPIRSEANAKKYPDLLNDFYKYSELKKYAINPKSIADLKAQLLNRAERAKWNPEKEKAYRLKVDDEYKELVKADISKGYKFPNEVLNYDKSFKTAVDSRARYEKGLATSFSADDSRIIFDDVDTIGAGMKRQDGKPIEQAQIDEIKEGVIDFANILGLDMKKLAENNRWVYVHLNGKNPFLMKMTAGLYREGKDSVSISVGGRESFEKIVEGKKVKEYVNTTVAHELGHAIDGKVSGKLFDSSLLWNLRKEYNPIEFSSRGSKYWGSYSEITARMIEQYVSVRKGSNKMYSREGYWKKEIFDRDILPNVEKSIEKHFSDYRLREQIKPKQVKEVKIASVEPKKTVEKPVVKPDEQVKPKISVIASRLNEALPDGMKIDETYEPKVIKEELDKAANAIGKDKEKAIQKAFDPNTNPVERDAILIELSEIAKRDGDYAAMADLFQRRTELIRSGAQSLNMEKASILMNPQEKYMRDIVNARLSKVKVNGKDLTDVEVASIRKSVRKETSEAAKKAFKIQDAQELFNSLIC